jgi:hypothetical protein
MKALALAMALTCSASGQIIDLDHVSGWSEYRIAAYNIARVESRIVVAKADLSRDKAALFRLYKAGKLDRETWQGKVWELDYVARYEIRLYNELLKELDLALAKTIT